MKTSDFHYDLPAELIAQSPAERRDQSRLLVYHRQDKAVEHRVFSNILDYIQAGDALVINKTRVLPARLIGKRYPTGGKAEFLLLRRLDANCWEAAVKPGRTARPGGQFVFGRQDELKASIESLADEGLRIVRFDFEGTFEDILEQVGHMPIPPYITQYKGDLARYQTVYAKENGSAAAPTAGLHFTQALLDHLREKDIQIVEVTLHVGLGTFRPVRQVNIEDHHMHMEEYCIDQQAASTLNHVRAKGGRIFAVGTTCVRVLESNADMQGQILHGRGQTDIFIYPGYRFRAVDALITNFHLPQSTLIMLVAAFAGHEQTLSLYRQAVEARYRFFSFGDAMLIL